MVKNTISILHSKFQSQSWSLTLGPESRFLGPESESGVLNFLTPESELHKK